MYIVSRKQGLAILALHNIEGVIEIWLSDSLRRRRIKNMVYETRSQTVAELWK